MAINIHERYEKQLAQEFEKHSYIGKNTNKDWSFEGVGTIKVSTADKMPLVDYKRKGTQRFGELNEIGDSVQSMTVTQDKGFSGSIDAGYASEQQKIKRAGQIMQTQVRDVLNPHIDHYAFGKWSKDGGIIKGMAAPTKANITNAVFDAVTAMDNEDVPMEGKVLYIGSTHFNNLRLSKEFLEAQSLVGRILGKGEVGMVADCKVVKMPDRMLPAGVHFMITHPSSVILAKKINMTRILEEVMGVHGSVLEGRSIFDAFVLGARAAGVYVAADTSLVLDAPALGGTGANVTATSAGNAIYYTTDNSDPRYSDSAKVYTSQVTLEKGQTFKACARNDAKLVSPVVSKAYNG